MRPPISPCREPVPTRAAPRRACLAALAVAALAWAAPPGRTQAAPAPTAGQDAAAEPREIPAPGEPLPEGATWTETASGLAWVALKRGDEKAERPKSRCDRVSVHYTGYFEDGKVFDQSDRKGEPVSFGLSQVIAGWTEGLQLMRVGDSFKLHIPWALAYGERGRAGIPPRSNLVFDVELVAVTPGAVLPPEPSFALPPDAELKKTASGLQYKLLVPGGEKHPVASDFVTVHYSGWLTDGTLFDSSWKRCEPASFPLGGVIPGWTEGLQLVGEGGSVLLVIPPDLGYGAAGAGGRSPVHRGRRGGP